MRWLSESAEALISDELSQVHEHVVIGSGYGGAVAALRLAEAGRAVLVLERGEEYLPGEFPDDIANLPSHLRLERWNRKQTEGDESGLFDVRLGESAGVLVGNALGGTSQINANVLIEPDPRLYEQREWSGALTKKELEPYFEKARQTLGFDRFSGVYDAKHARWLPDSVLQDFRARGVDPFATGFAEKAGWVRVDKHAALEGLAEKLSVSASSTTPPPCLEDCSVEFERADIVVNLHGGKDLRPNPAGAPTRQCTGCGDCVSGCNYSAKNTLMTSYLPRAKAMGARMFTGVTVLDLARDTDERGPLWNIRFVRTADRKSLRKYKNGSENLSRVLRARKVIVSAGSLGSTEILLRSKHVNELRLSGSVGSRFSGNGDYLAFGYIQDAVVRGVGRGSRRHEAGAAPVGPTITGVISIKHRDDLDRDTVIEEGSVPGAAARVFHELVTTMAAVSQLTSDSYRGEGAANPEVDPLALQPAALAHTQTLLAMGHDGAGGVLEYDETADRLTITWPRLKDVEVYKLHDDRLRHIEELGAIYLQNPAWRPLPDSVTDALSGPALGNTTFTVHPLGGCPMKGQACDGAVDDIGRVYDDSGRPHEGLYVLDGSIVPRSLGVNPLLTITAVAERALDKIVAPKPAPPERAKALPERPLVHPYANPDGDQLALEFTEILRGEIRYRSSDRRERRAASLMLHLPIADLQRFFESPSHPIQILGDRGNDVERLPAQFQIAGAQGEEPLEFEVASGTVEIFEPKTRAGLRQVGPLMRVALTWFIERGHDELHRAALNWLKRKLGIGRPSEPESKVPILTLVCDWFKMAKHATESRNFGYSIDLNRDGRAYYLKGVKRFEYAASWGALWTYAVKRLARLFGKKPYLERTNVWTSLGLLGVELYEDGKLVAEGDLTMDLADMTHHYAAQLGPKRDTASALLALAGYPLLFLRAMIKTRLWDFRLPDYPKERPAELEPHGRREPVPEKDESETPWPAFPSLRGPDGKKVAPRKSAEVRTGELRPNGKELVLKLTRYAQDQPLAPQKTASGMLQVKAIILVNGFAQPTLPFVATELEQNLAEYFYDLGYDVWLFDYRTSTILDSSKDPCTMDDVARRDIPAAVDHIIREYERELGVERSKLQIYAFAHCVGSASMAMSMLGGHLEHSAGRSKIAGVIFSQMQACLIGGETAQMRIPVGSVLRDVAGVDVMRLSAAEGKPTAFESLADRLLATLPTAEDERCPYENDRVAERPEIVTCKRASGVISRLFNHRRLSRRTHAKLDVYFGRANTTLLVHGTKCLAYERLVNADGQNVYVTDTNIQRHFRLPIALLHGRDNALFDIESCHRTYMELARINGWDFARRYYSKFRIEGYAHFDCIVGENAHRDVYPKLGTFLEEAWAHNIQGIDAVGDPDALERAGARLASRVAAPVAGPILGWVQPGGKECKVRLWIQVDEYEGDPPWCAMTVLRKRGDEDESSVKIWPIIRLDLETSDRSKGADARPPITPGVGYVAFAVADLELEADAKHGYDIDMVSLHVSPRDATAPNADSESGVPAPADYHRTRPRRRGVMTQEQILAANPVVSRAATRAEALVERAGAAPVREDPLNWIHRVRERLSEQARLRSTRRPPSVGDADRMLEVLRDTNRRTRETALSPDPGTLSRTRRSLPRDDTWTAHVKPATLAGPSPDGTLRFLAGCCRYPGMAFEGKRADRTFQYINDLLASDEAHRDFMLMLGDQIYADATAGVFDPRSPVEKFRLRYEQAFSSVEFRRLARQLPLYMVIDDHEIDNDWTRDELAGGREAERLFFTAMSSFAAYQWAHSPRNLAVPGFNYQFEAGGYRFLVLDTRTQRVRHGDPPVILAAEQVEALKAWLREGGDGPQPRFIVTGSVIAPGLQGADPTRSDAVFDSWQMAQEQRREVLDIVGKYRNVVLISGDYHCAATGNLAFASGKRAYAIVSPPFYAPYVYANAQAYQLKRSETVGRGESSVEISVEVADGNGFSDIRVDRLAAGKWSLEVSTYAMRFEDETPQFMPHTRQFVLS